MYIAASLIICVVVVNYTRSLWRTVYEVSTGDYLCDLAVRDLHVISLGNIWYRYRSSSVDLGSPWLWCGEKKLGQEEEEEIVLQRIDLCAFDMIIAWCFRWRRIQSFNIPCSYFKKFAFKQFNKRKSHRKKKRINPGPLRIDDCTEVELWHPTWILL